MGPGGLQQNIFSPDPTEGIKRLYEFGAEPDAGEPGPTGSVFGIGLSYAFRR